ncbi:LCP family protein [Streptomyces sp. ACA25]|uniref:LCP family protein n=1 Tax=Streptomyces sp. ACA25 TaxID=3022596 RepID=UPI002307841F|nr:LCP family protein [Streptomyces sp. ACA25]MDB1087167.1 LCP family protein [Streptomyces sp. ACA25]
MRRNGIRDEDAGGSVTAEDRGRDDSLRDEAPSAASGPHDLGGSEGADMRDGSGPGGDGPGEPPGTGGEPEEAEPPGTEEPEEPEEGKTKRPGWVRALRITAGVLSLTILVAGAAGALYVRHLNNNLTKADLNLSDRPLDKPLPNAAGQTPLNILLLGSDARDSEENLRLGGSRADAGRKPLADSQMLLHVAADRSHITAVSIPRDTRVSTPQCTDPSDGSVYPETESATINRSLQNGGPGCTVAVWERLTGIPVDHFMLVDFAGVVSMADAVGGVPVCVDENIDDHRSGLRLPAGTTTVQGTDALAWLRTRYGFGDGSDVGRAKAHQLYFTSMFRQLQDGSGLSDPAQLTRLAEAATKALTVDPGLGTVNKLFDLGEEIRQVPSESITMVTMPWVPDPRNPRAHVVPDERAAERIFSAIRNDVPLDDAAAQAEAEEAEEAAAVEAGASPREQIPVLVRNGTGASAGPPVTDRAADISEALQDLGWTGSDTDGVSGSQADTTLSMPDEEHRADAQLLAGELSLPETALRVTPEVSQLLLVIGDDWREGTRYPAPPGGDDDAAEDAILDSTEAVTGKDRAACMSVNPRYTW